MVALRRLLENLASRMPHEVQQGFQGRYIEKWWVSTENQVASPIVSPKAC